MNDYRINVRFHTDLADERKAAEYLQALKKSRNKFIVGAVIDAINREFSENETLLEQIRQIFREEVQTVTVSAAQIPAATVSQELTEEQKAENARNILEDLEMFG